MEVRPDILEKLLCSVCDEYLSCAPVCMKRDGTILCGRCSGPFLLNMHTQRMTPYEDLAEMVLFPCLNKKHGCTETLYMAEMKDHEEECEYKQYECPVTETGQCDWSGARKKILDHCKEKHPANLLQDPYAINLTINAKDDKTFLLAAFQMLFIIHCKVCTTTKNIYQSVRLNGQSALANQYRNELEVVLNSDEDDTFTRKRDVAPESCKLIHEDTIFKFSRDLKDVIFKIKVGRKCVKCRKCVFKSAWPINGGWCCEDCSPAKRQCKFNNKGCSYTDIEPKAVKHETGYCPYSGKRTPSENSKAGATWRASVGNKKESNIIMNDVGKLLCIYILNDSHFTLSVLSPLHTEQLSDYRCVVTLTNPGTGHTVRKILRLKYGELTDWQLILNKDKFLMYVSDNEFVIKLELIKK